MHLDLLLVARCAYCARPFVQSAVRLALYDGENVSYVEVVQ